MERTDRLLRDLDVRGIGRFHRSRCFREPDPKLQNDPFANRQQSDTFHTEEGMRKRVRVERRNQEVCRIVRKSSATRSHLRHARRNEGKPCRFTFAWPRTSPAVRPSVPRGGGERRAQKGVYPLCLR